MSKWNTETTLLGMPNMSIVELEDVEDEDTTRKSGACRVRFVAHGGSVTKQMMMSRCKSPNVTKSVGK